MQNQLQSDHFRTILY